MHSQTLESSPSNQPSANSQTRWPNVNRLEKYFASNTDSLIIMWVFVGLGILAAVQMASVHISLRTNKNAITENSQTTKENNDILKSLSAKLDRKTSDRWTRSDMVRLVEEFNAAHPDIVPVEIPK